MKSIRLFFRLIGKLISVVYSKKVSLVVNSIIYEIYSGIVACRFKSFGGSIIGTQLKVRGGKYITVGKGVVFFNGCRIEAYDRHGDKNFVPHLSIGENTKFSSNTQINCVNSIIIGKDCGIGANVYISDAVHGDFRPMAFTFNQNPDIPDVFLQKVEERELLSKPIVIEDNVHIGQNSIILPGVTIGHNSIVAAQSVVSKSVPPYSVVSGNPATIAIKCID